MYDFDEDTTVPVVSDCRSGASGAPHRNDLGRGVLNAMKAGIAEPAAPTSS